MHTMQFYLKRKYRRFLIYHIYFRRSGFYNFFIKNLVITILSVLVIYFLFSIVQRYIIDLGLVFENMVKNFRTFWVFFTFFLSECFLGLLPPDFFILWAKDFHRPYHVVTVLSILSFAGGIISYWIGQWLSRNKKVSHFVAIRYKKNFGFVKKWGGFFIVLAALFPLPFSAVSMLAGTLRFPFLLFLTFSSTRFIRFYVYAYVIFSMVKS